MRLDDLYLVDIIEARETIAELMAGAKPAEFRESKLLCSAVQLHLIVIGEALSAMKTDTRARLPARQVQIMRDLRNRITHGYFTVDEALIYSMATKHAPRIALSAEQFLESFFPETYAKLKARRANFESG